MANISNFLKNKMLDKAIGGVDFVPASSLWLRAYTTPLNASGVGTELASNGYAPLEFPNNSTNFPNAVNGAKSNNVRFDFEPAEENWDLIESFGFWDAESGGNLYFYQNLAEPVQVNETQNLYFDSGDIDFSLS